MEPKSHQQSAMNEVRNGLKYQHGRRTAAVPGNWGEIGERGPRNKEREGERWNLGAERSLRGGEDFSLKKKDNK